MHNLHTFSYSFKIETWGHHLLKWSLMDNIVSYLSWEHLPADWMAGWYIDVTGSKWQLLLLMTSSF